MLRVKQKNLIENVMDCTMNVSNLIDFLLKDEPSVTKKLIALIVTTKK